MASSYFVNCIPPNGLSFVAAFGPRYLLEDFVLYSPGPALQLVSCVNRRQGVVELWPLFGQSDLADNRETMAQLVIEVVVSCPRGLEHLAPEGKVAEGPELFVRGGGSLSEEALHERVRVIVDHLEGALLELMCPFLPKGKDPPSVSSYLVRWPCDSPRLLGEPH